MIRPMCWWMTALAWLLLGAMGAAAERTAPLTCTYEMSSWNVRLKRSVGQSTVRHPYRELTEDEIDPDTGCTVCSEDQEQIHIYPLQPFFLCHKIAPRVRRMLAALMEREEPIFTVQGYRVIKSRGSIDGSGNRTRFSNHSFGTAVDVNRELNGLYDHCIQFGPQCRLLQGGHWRPGIPGTLERDGVIVKAFKAQGFRWGGEIEGRQKDFMHFSLTGY